MKKGLTRDDLPRRVQVGAYAANLARVFYESGDEVWEVTFTDDLPPGKPENIRASMQTAMTRNGSGKTAKRGDSLFLIKAEDA